MLYLIFANWKGVTLNLIVVLIYISLKWNRVVYIFMLTNLLFSLFQMFVVVFSGCLLFIDPLYNLDISLLSVICVAISLLAWGLSFYLFIFWGKAAGHSGWRKRTWDLFLMALSSNKLLSIYVTLCTVLRKIKCYNED